jgi:hypothetical protein
MPTFQDSFGNSDSQGQPPTDQLFHRVANMRRYRKVIVAASVLILAAVVAAYVWPTAYRPIAIQPSARILAAREQRFTHRVQLLTVEGWRDVRRALPRDSTRGNTADTTWDPLSNYTPNWRKK